MADRVGFVSKHSAGRQLLVAIGAVLNGKKYASPKLRRANDFELKSRPNQFQKRLKGRQLDVVQLLAEGKVVKEVAQLLEISEKTVEFHKRQAMQSFGLKAYPDLVIFALKNRLIWAGFLA
jgi:DNA-binding NarL/FixJ family response regulator